MDFLFRTLWAQLCINVNMMMTERGGSEGGHSSNRKWYEAARRRKKNDKNTPGGTNENCYFLYWLTHTLFIFLTSFSVYVYYTDVDGGGVGGG